MPYPWVNTLLLAFVMTALVTGYLGLTNGDPDKAWILAVHAVAAFAIVAVLAWKAALVTASLLRNPIASTPRRCFVLMAGLFLFVLASGLVWSHAGRIVFAPVSLIELHQWAAVVVALLLAWHVLARKWVWSLPPARDRRAFLRLAAAGIAGIALWQVSSVFAGLTGLPGDRRRFTGSYETGSFTGAFPRVSWGFDAPSRVDTSSWRFEINGAVERPVRLTSDELLALPTTSLDVILDCTGGWYTEQTWSGVSLEGLLAMARPRQGWQSIEVISVTGYSRRFSREEAVRAILATSVAGRPLSHGHGAPARLVMPDHRGFDWVKWVTRVRVLESSQLWQPPLPLP